MEHICKRCGLCCIILTNTKEWLKGNLTKEEQEQLMMKIVNRKPTPYCEALIYKDGKAVCLIHKLFGWDKKPETCKNFPTEKYKCYFDKLKGENYDTKRKNNKRNCKSSR